MMMISITLLCVYLNLMTMASCRTTQTYHGGQDWRNIGNFVEDFSVTTNGLGTPKAALAAAKKAVGR